MKPVFYLLLAALLPVGVEPSHVEWVVSAVLVVILLDGGRGIGLARFRAEAPAILGLGLAGTFATVAGAALAAHLVLGLSWYLCVLLGTALAPTDPAVVFSLLGSVEGRGATVLEGESGANDPVGIALMAALLDAGSLSGRAVSDALVAFVLQLAVGAAVGVAGGLVLRRLPRLLALPAAFGLFALADVGHGSGFLAVFVAGIVLGGDQLHVLVGTLGEALAFLSLGLLVVLPDVADSWLEGLALFALLAFVVRPVLCLPFVVHLGRRQGRFVLLAGLKGAVPLLLGAKLLDVPHGHHLYAVTTVVVVLSVLVQGALVPRLAPSTDSA